MTLGTPTPTFSAPTSPRSSRSSRASSSNPVAPPATPVTGAGAVSTMSGYADSMMDPSMAQGQATALTSDAYGQLAGANAMYAAQQNQIQNQIYGQNQAQQAAQNQFATQAYNNNLGLLGADQYRNVDLGFMTNDENRRYITQTWQNLQNYLAGRTQNVEGVWGNQQNFYNKMAPLDFNTWAAQRAQNLLATKGDLDSARTNATARGAMSSRGYQSGRFDREEQSRVTDRDLENQYNIRRLNADTTLEGQRLSYQDALNQINHQRNEGSNSYTHGMSGTDIQNLMLQSLAQTYGLRGDQLGIQLQQALSGNNFTMALQQLQNQMMNSQYEQSVAQSNVQALMQQLGLF